MIDSGATIQKAVATLIRSMWENWRLGKTMRCSMLALRTCSTHGVSGPLRFVTGAVVPEMPDSF